MEKDLQAATPAFENALKKIVEYCKIPKNML
jgi:hypothetical protein